MRGKSTGPMLVVALGTLVVSIQVTATTAVRAAPLSIPTATTVRASVDTLGGDQDASSGDLERAAAIADGNGQGTIRNDD